LEEEGGVKEGWRMKNEEEIGGIKKRTDGGVKGGMKEGGMKEGGMKEGNRKGG
jgi:hypothetical protein